MGNPGNTPDKIPAWPLALLRIFTGLFLIYSALQLVGADYLTSPIHLQEVFQQAARTMPDYLGNYKTWHQHYLLTQWNYVNYTLIFGEFAVGLLLVLGFLTRLAALAGMLLMLFLFLSFGHATGPAMPATAGYTMGYFMIFLVFLLCGAGRSFGLDRLVFKPPATPSPVGASAEPAASADQPAASNAPTTGPSQ